MKETLLDALKWFTSVGLFFTAGCLFYGSMDVLNSLVAGMGISLINELPVSIAVYALMWSLIICAVKCFLSLNRFTMTEQAHSKLGWFTLLLVTLLLVMQTGHDIAFSYKLGLHRSVLFRMPVNKWLMGSLVIGWFFIASSLIDQFVKVFHVKEVQEIRDFLKEEDQ